MTLLGPEMLVPETHRDRRGRAEPHRSEGPPSARSHIFLVDDCAPGLRGGVRPRLHSGLQAAGSVRSGSLPSPVPAAAELPALAPPLPKQSAPSVPSNKLQCGQLRKAFNYSTRLQLHLSHALAKQPCTRGHEPCAILGAVAAPASPLDTECCPHHAVVYATYH